MVARFVHHKPAGIAFVPVPTAKIVGPVDRIEEPLEMDRSRLAHRAVPQDLSKNGIARRVAVIEGHPQPLARATLHIQHRPAFGGVDGERFFTNDVAARLHRFDDVTVVSSVDRGDYHLVYLLFFEQGGKFPRLAAHRLQTALLVFPELAQPGDGMSHPGGVGITEADELGPVGVGGRQGRRVKVGPRTRTHQCVASASRHRGIIQRPPSPEPKRARLTWATMPLVGQDDHIDIDTVAGELYGLAPSEFTARRDALAAEARRAGDKALAAEIKKLRRPTAGAWLANLLTRERGQQVAGLLDLGAALRAAQAKLAPDDLRRLSLERHHQVAELEREARGLASQHGQTVSDAAAQELAATLEAALADEDAANALRAGRLTTGVHYSGLGLVGLGPDASGGFEGQESIGAAGPAEETRVSACRTAGRTGPGTATAEPASAFGGEPVPPRQRGQSVAGPGRGGRGHSRARCEREAHPAEPGKDRTGPARQGNSRPRTSFASTPRSRGKSGGDVRAAEQALDAAERAVLAAQDELARAKAVVATGA